ncbi:MAG: efflux RND transporter permease subunit, partial [Limisphaerales bacterium]
LQLELFPKGFDGHSLSVRVPWRSAVPQEVMEKIAQPLEDELNTVRGVDSMTASCSSSSASVYLRFKQGTDMDVAYREVRDRLERAKLRFPEDVEYTYIYKMDMSGIPVCMIGMAYDVPPEVDLYDFVNKKIVTPLTRIDGVANVDARGLDEKEIIIEIDKAKSEAYGLDIYTLSRKLRGDNFNLASGNVQDGGKKYLLKSTSTYHTIDQLRNLPISTNVILSDVAVLKYEPEERRYVTRVNSKKAMAITVTKESTANTVAVCDQVVAELERMKQDPELAAFDLHMYVNQGGIVMTQLNTLYTNGKIGAFFAAIVLYLFLRRLRITLIITLAIPLCLFISVAAMYFAGESLNLLTILGLVICVGLLVDNSVV